MFDIPAAIMFAVTFAITFMQPLWFQFVVCFGYKSPLASQYPDFQSCLVLKWTFNENLQLFRNHIIHFTPILEKAADGSKMEGSFPVGEIDKRHIGCRIKWSLVMHGFQKPGCR